MLIQQNIYNSFLIAILLVITDLSKQTTGNCHEDFQCNNTYCISRTKICDGKYDCANHSDEKNCDINEVIGKCLTPTIRNGKYEVMGNEKNISGLVPNLATIKFSCNNGNYKLTTRYNTVKCLEGNYSEDLPNCISICTPEFPTSIDVDCELYGIEQDCTKQVIEGTIAYMKCKPNYIDNNPEISQTMCSNGNWSLPPKQCTSPYSCPPRFSNAIDIICELNGVMQDCSKEVPDGTVSHMNCKPNYVDIKEQGSSDAICSKGIWNIPLKQCIPDCNQIITEGKTFIVNGKTVDRGDFPWHVAVYRQKPKEPVTYICGGSIISVKIVISAAHCFTVQSTGKLLLPISQFSLAAGKHYSKWNATEDTYHVQKKKIIKIEIPADVYFGAASNYAGDLAVVIVDKAFIITSRIKPVCVDWNSEYIKQQLTNGTMGKVVGWGSTNGSSVENIDLKELKLPFVKRGECAKIVPKNFIRYITTDKYCAGYTNGSSVCVGDSGGGMVFLQEDAEKKRYYLQGIVSVGPKKDTQCDNRQLGVYTEVNEYIEFIREIEESNRIDCTPNCLVNAPEIHPAPIYKRSKGCVAPIIQNGKFSVSDIEYTPGSDSLIKEFSVIYIECNSGYEKSANIFPKCIAGVWNTKIPKCKSQSFLSYIFGSLDGTCLAPVIPNVIFEVLGYPEYNLGDRIPNYSLINFTCINDNYVLNTTYNLIACVNGYLLNSLPNSVRCPARFSNTIDIDCELNGVKQNCSKEVPEGTIATMKCTLDGETYPEPTTANCSQGIWNEPLRLCVSECKGSHIITEESIRDCGEFVSNTTEQFDIVKRGDFPWHVTIVRILNNYGLCGGSIISEKIVLTVADCFTNNRGNLYPVSEFLIAAGKQYNDWNAPKDENFVQKRKICKIEISNKYFGEESNYEGDIAVAVIETPFEFSNFIKPVCVDWNSEYAAQQLKDGSVGQVTGWGRDYFNSNPILTYVTVPVVEFNQCYKKAPFEYKLFITDDKYCVQSRNGVSTCSTNDGSGMVFPYEKLGNKKYYIQGIQSISLKNKYYCDNNQLTTFTRVVDYISFIRNVTNSKAQTRYRALQPKKMLLELSSTSTIGRYTKSYLSAVIWLAYMCMSL